MTQTEKQLFSQVLKDISSISLSQIKRLRQPKYPNASALIKFTAEEINQMSDPFKNLFACYGSVARVLKYLKGKRKVIYEIRYCRHGFNISVTHKDLRTAKALFIKEAVRVCAELNKT